MTIPTNLRQIADRGADHAAAETQAALATRALTDDLAAALLDEEPIEVGWYAYSGGAQSMIFHLRETGQWSVHSGNGSAADCAWGYIEQALGVWDLVRLDLPTTPDQQALTAAREAVAAASEVVAAAREVVRLRRTPLGDVGLNDHLRAWHRLAAALGSAEVES